ncbi:MAG: peptidoglycan recognition family protein [Cyanobacteria bacterium]|nr:peptidoglycan recognition family protein [Cyanobacteriota bacterium]MDA1246110.1 peptidoglycan recognition family protein [Cyanobacteriota bacterium]
MNSSPQPLWIALGAGAILTLGGLGWLTRDLSAQPSGGKRHPSLLELLEEVRQASPVPESGRQAAPAPPAHRPWQSPLRASCAPGDPAHRLRLQQLAESIKTSPARVQIHPTNFGERFNRDAYGNPVDPTPQLVVLHETVYGIGSAINTFVTPHPRDEDQVSYHTLIGGDGSVVQVLDPSKRAFGAGNSAFNGRWVVSNAKVGGSVNNFSLHVSLETPLDGEDDGPAHSGYTSAQYDVLAALLARWMQSFPIPAAHITTHRAVDLGGERADPRSFNWSELQIRLQSLGLLCRS